MITYSNIQPLRWLQTAASCKQRGAPSCDTHGVDLSKSDEVRKFAKDVLDKYKNVDILVNNAGMGPSSGSGPIKGGNVLEHNRTASMGLHFPASHVSLL